MLNSFILSNTIFFNILETTHFAVMNWEVLAEVRSAYLKSRELCELSQLPLHEKVQHFSLVVVVSEAL